MSCYFILVKICACSFIFSHLKFLAMPEFDTSHVKNIVLLGHAGSGKTTLAECMLYEAGIITRRGSIAERNTTGD